MLEDTRKQMGLNGSVAERYSKSLRNTLRLDLGQSLQTGYPVASLLASKARSSLPLILAATVLTAAAAGIAGWYYCSHDLSPTKRLLLTLAPSTFVPQFAVATCLSIASIVLTDFFPEATRRLQIADILLVASTASMPAGILFVAAAQSAREAATRRFVATYQAIGLPWRRIRVILQANVWIGLVPIANRLVLALITGTVFSEIAFDHPGIGSVLADAIRSGDQPLASGWMIAISCPLILISQIASAWARRFPMA